MTSPRVIRLGDTAGYRQAAQYATAELSHGGLVVAPTETRYGLLARADHPEAVLAMCRAKSRSPNRPVAAFVNGVEQLDLLGVMTPAARSLAGAFLPGPLTLVLEGRVDWPPPLVVDGLIGLRVSSSALIDALLTAGGFSLTATSANLAGNPESEAVEEIIEAFGSKVALYLDGGRLTGPVSTVVMAAPGGVRILREGAIPASDIVGVVGETLVG